MAKAMSMAKAMEMMAKEAKKKKSMAMRYTIGPYVVMIPDPDDLAGENIPASLTLEMTYGPKSFFSPDLNITVRPSMTFMTKLKKKVRLDGVFNGLGYY